MLPIVFRKPRSGLLLHLLTIMCFICSFSAHAEEVSWRAYLDGEGTENNNWEDGFSYYNGEQYIGEPPGPTDYARFSVSHNNGGGSYYGHSYDVYIPWSFSPTTAGGMQVYDDIVTMHFNGTTTSRRSLILENSLTVSHWGAPLNDVFFSTEGSLTLVGYGDLVSPTVTLGGGYPGGVGMIDVSSGAVLTGSSHYGVDVAPTGTLTIGNSSGGRGKLTVGHYLNPESPYTIDPDAPTGIYFGDINVGWGDGIGILDVRGSQSMLRASRVSIGTGGDYAHGSVYISDNATAVLDNGFNLKNGHLTIDGGASVQAGAIYGLTAEPSGDSNPHEINIRGGATVNLSNDSGGTFGGLNTNEHIRTTVSNATVNMDRMWVAGEVTVDSGAQVTVLGDAQVKTDKADFTVEITDANTVFDVQNDLFVGGTGWNATGNGSKLVVSNGAALSVGNTLKLWDNSELVINNGTVTAGLVEVTNTTLTLNSNDQINADIAIQSGGDLNLGITTQHFSNLSYDTAAATQDDTVFNAASTIVIDNVYQDDRTTGQLNGNISTTTFIRKGGTINANVTAANARIEQTSIKGSLDLANDATIQNSEVTGSVTGTGNLILDGTAVKSELTYTGTTTVAGVTILNDAGRLANSTGIDIADGGTLSLQYNSSNDRISDTASISLNDNSSLQLNSTMAINETAQSVLAVDGESSITVDGSANLALSELKSMGGSVFLRQNNGGTITLDSTPDPDSGSVLKNVFVYKDISGSETAYWVANQAGVIGEAQIAAGTLDGSATGDYIRLDGSTGMVFNGNQSIAGLMIDTDSAIQIQGNLDVEQILFTGNGSLSMNSLQIGGAEITVVNVGNNTISGGLTGNGNIRKLGQGAIVFDASSHSMVGDMVVAEGNMQVNGDVLANIQVKEGASFIADQYSAGDQQDTISGIVSNLGGQIVNRSTMQSFINVEGNVTNEGQMTLEQHSAGIIDNEIQGTLNFDSSGETVTVEGAINNRGGTIDVEEGISTAGAGEFVQHDGTMIVNGNVANNITVKAGELMGAGSIEGELIVENGAVLMPGNSPGTMSLLGGVTLEAGSSLELEVTSTMFDMLIIDGPVFIDPLAKITFSFLEEGLDETFFQTDEINLSSVFQGVEGSPFDLRNSFSNTMLLHFNLFSGEIRDVAFSEFTSSLPSAVPVPASVWLFGSGLLGLIGFARRKKA